MELENLVTVIAASCIMHNICEMNNKEVLLQWLEESSLATANFPQPDGNTLYDINEREDSVSIRNDLTDYFMSDEGFNIGTG